MDMPWRPDEGLTIDAKLMGRRFKLARMNRQASKEQVVREVRAMGFDITARLLGIYEDGDPKRGPKVPPPHIMLAILKVLKPPGGKEWVVDCFPEEIRDIWLEGPTGEPNPLLELVRSEHPLIMALLETPRREASPS